MTFAEAANILEKKLNIPSEEGIHIIEKAIIGGEIASETGVENWLNDRLFPNCVTIDENGYSKMCVDALKILGSTAATDYGGSRQRDLGQLWADMTRGYLGEYAFKLFLKNKYNIDATLGHDIGTLADYLPMDIHGIKEEGKYERKPKISISLKATKWNGIWFDIPGDQFSHSDVHVMVKVGVGRDHLFAFFKSLSVFKDKVLKRGEDVGVISKEQSNEIYNNLPSFKPITAYVCGFVRKDTLFQHLDYKGKKGRMHYKISSWNGPIEPGDLDKVKEKEIIATNGLNGAKQKNIEELKKCKVSFEGINEFAHDKGYLFNAGVLQWSDVAWKSILEKL